MSKNVSKNGSKKSNYLEIDCDKLIDIVQKSTKKNYLARNQDGKIVQNVANIGAKKGQIGKLERPGEYYGIAVEFLENVKILLTDYTIIKILKLMKKENYTSALNILDIVDINELYYVLHTWFQHATTQYENEIKINFDNESYHDLDHWIKTVRSDPLPGKIKIMEIGFNEKTGGSVLPPDWIDKCFDNGTCVHKQMDKLETRIGKPPATYAIIYSMVIQQQDELITDPSKLDYSIIFYLDLIDGKIMANQFTKLKKKYMDYHYVKYGDTLIGFKLADILEPKKNINGVKQVGIFVSRLQKCIRRGRYGSSVLRDTINNLNECPNYNLPEHGFIRVSSAKQLVWRLFISILEDCRPYTTKSNEIGLLELILLVLITQKCQEYKFTKQILELITITALLAQYNDTPNDLFDWRKLPEAKSTPINEKSPYHTSLSLALDNVIMMSGDRYMLSKLYSAKNNFEIFNRPKDKNLSSESFNLVNKDICQDILLTSIDHHCRPNIILYYQACIPVSMTTKEISKYIWNISSSYNIRSTKTKNIVDPILREIQLYFHQNLDKDITTDIKSTSQAKTLNVEPNYHVKRSSFLILFGNKYRYKKLEVILAGTIETPARIKIDNEWTYSNDINIINAYPPRWIYTNKIDPPFGFEWKKNKFHTEIIDGKPYVDGNLIEFFDGSSLIKSITPNITTSCNSSTYNLVINFLSGIDIDFKTILELKSTGKTKIYNWIPKKSDYHKLDMDLVKSVYTKLYNQFNNNIMVGPCDRMGNKMHNSINYSLEGKIWAVLNLFHYLYPETLKPKGTLNFYLNKETQGYVHLISCLQQILFDNTKITGLIPKIKTKLWDHQLETVNTIIAGFKSGQHGFGDASDVGSGKTLTALQIAVHLIKSNNLTHSGILVLLPGNKLIKTWQDELEKHTVGFDIILHKPSGIVNNINRNTIIISTMGRIRDNPINHKWLLVVIDECLSVQNKNALQTEQAFIQSLMSKYLIMMSATFFRTRFDKLYYMLKMLQTGLPEMRQYLDTILIESIIAKIPKNNRKWITNINYFKLDTNTINQYNNIEKKYTNVETKYSKLTSFLVSNSDVNKLVVKQLRKLILNLEKQNRRCLIYARSSTEAELWSKKLNISIYPKKGNHCIVSYHDGTYGLNDLVIYDTIVMRPCQPDSLPQIKGRLNRPGQESNDLYIEYFLIQDTIEEGLLIRMNIASQFVHQYIMPLAKFYDISVNHKKYSNH
ncbi:putative helicase [Acanthamoeba polyphaga mimivirus]|uniref:Putative helicase n=1 Tax=Acanthamoeba polyphaga mimivirus TaxID=212035 RepID=A0A2L2DKG1_MIMIV|nr:putative helicase [Acanthamoeba polyphaga mimivirus]